ncbi:MAG: indole-3-glycerol phosphate synthase TrpC [Acidobacteriia bacterium]|nr:indole-3-glycerol phosphate synthase TrpC [Terriglobia bacterium]
MTTIAAKYSLPAELKETILEQIMAARLPEVESAKIKLPAESLRMALERGPQIRSLKRALMRRPGIIAEIKKASPSCGLLRPDFDPAAIADQYRKAGASAISVVTENRFFQGGLEILAGLRWRMDLPLLRKDFVVDPYQVLEARHAGADAVLLIAALLAGPSLRAMRGCVEELGMDALVEVHTEQELDRALEAGATLIGVNSRNLKNFEVSLDVCRRLAVRLPREAVAVAESGIRTAEDIRLLAGSGYRGFLIGAALMRAPSPGAALEELILSMEMA